MTTSLCHRLSHPLGCLLLLLCLTAVTEARTWTTKSGRSFEADFVDVEGNNIVLSIGGQEIPYPASDFIREDLDYVRDEMRRRKQDEATPKSEMRLWTDNIGQRRRGAFVTKRGDTVVLELPDGSRANAPFEMFSKEDQQYIEDLMAGRDPKARKNGSTKPGEEPFKFGDPKPEPKDDPKPMPEPMPTPDRSPAESVPGENSGSNGQGNPSTEPGTQGNDPPPGDSFASRTPTEEDPLSAFMGGGAKVSPRQPGRSGSVAGSSSGRTRSVTSSNTQPSRTTSTPRPPSGGGRSVVVNPNGGGGGSSLFLYGGIALAIGAGVFIFLQRRG